jgi:acyl-CoA thioester hydrolase
VSDLPAPSHGLLRGGTHFLPIRVYYEDTDAGGIVYHAAYLRFAERARTEMLRAVGIDLVKLRDEHGLLFVVRKGEVDYERPAKFDDVLIVQSDLIALGGATATVDQRIHRMAGARELGDKVAAFRAHVACVQNSGRVGRLPADVRDRMKALVRESLSKSP